MAFKLADCIKINLSCGGWQFLRQVFQWGAFIRLVSLLVPDESCLLLFWNFFCPKSKQFSFSSGTSIATWRWWLPIVLEINNFSAKLSLTNQSSPLPAALSYLDFETLFSEKCAFLQIKGILASSRKCVLLESGLVNRKYGGLEDLLDRSSL